MLLEIHADAAEKDAFAADVGLIGESRRIERDQRHVVTLRDQFRRQRVVTQTTAAVHIRGAGGDSEDLHDARASRARWNARRAYR